MKNKPYKERINELTDEIAMANASFGHQKQSADSWRDFALVSNLFWVIMIILILVK